jgi:hypothetical protein
LEEESNFSNSDSIGEFHVEENHDETHVHNQQKRSLDCEANQLVSDESMAFEISKMPEYKGNNNVINDE